MDIKNEMFAYTSQSMRKKLCLTNRYIRNSYRQILKINRAFDRILADFGPALNHTPLIIYCPTPILIRRKEEKQALASRYQAANLIELLKKIPKHQEAYNIEF